MTTRVLCASLVAAALAAPAVPAFCDDAAAFRAYGRGVDALDKRDFHAAEKAFREAVADKPDYAEAYDKLGQALYDEDKQMDAVAELKLAVSIDPRLTSAWYHLGQSFEDMDRDTRLKDDDHSRRRLRLSDPASAMQAYRTALEVSPANDVWSEAHSEFRLGVLLRDQAIAAWAAANPDQSLVAPPEPVGGQPQGQPPSAERSNLKEAMGHLEAAVRLLPDFPEAHNELGRLYDFIGRYHAAVDEYTQAIDEKAGYAEAYSNRGVSWWKAGNWDRALADTLRATQIAPGFAGGHYNFAEVLYAHVQVLRIAPTVDDQSLIHLEARKAIDEYSQATTLDPSFLPGWYGLARAYRGYFDFHDAEQTYAKLLQLAPRQRLAKREWRALQKQESGYYSDVPRAYRPTPTPAPTSEAGGQ